MSHKRAGLHVGEPYSKTGLTIALNRRSIKSNLRCVKHLLISPTLWLALETIEVIWFLGLMSLDMVMSRSFWLLTDFNGTPSRVYKYLRDYLILRTTHLWALQFSSHLEDQATSLFRSSCRCLQDSSTGCENTLLYRQQAFLLCWRPVQECH